MIVGTCWYLAGLLFLASLCGSFITVAPGIESWFHEVMAGCVAGSLFFAITASFLHRRQWRWITESKLAKYLFLGFAALATVVFAPFIIG